MAIQRMDHVSIVVAIDDIEDVLARLRHGGRY
jgi:vacuolar-type H+-ATPase subunit I/STV1